MLKLWETELNFDSCRTGNQVRITGTKTFRFDDTVFRKDAGTVPQCRSEKHHSPAWDYEHIHPLPRFLRIESVTAAFRLSEGCAHDHRR
jgi:hypothetical protein